VRSLISQTQRHSAAWTSQWVLSIQSGSGSSERGKNGFTLNSSYLDHALNASFLGSHHHTFCHEILMKFLFVFCRYETWEDPEIPRFHYGSHYSSAGSVLFYLIRLPPFSQENKQLQGGAFDHADRLFNSIRDTWLSASQGSTADVKELIPEFFYLPEFLENRFDFDFGVKQSGDRVSIFYKRRPKKILLKIYLKNIPFVHEPRIPVLYFMIQTHNISNCAMNVSKKPGNCGAGLVYR